MTGLASPVSSTTSASLAGAVRLAIAGDEMAFARIVSAFHGDLLRVAYVIAGDEQLAEDAAQSAWSIAWRKLSSLRDAECLRPWLVSVAANEARQLVRGQHRRSVTEVKVGPVDGTAGDPWGEIDRIDLVNVLHRLKPEDRRLLALRYVTGLDSTEIGTILGMSPPGVRGHLSRLLERLRKELSDG
jgi:RNA polymerase sigma-70 factor (ECF subfamily)